jgi:hypothetical protein
MLLLLLLLLLNIWAEEWKTLQLEEVMYIFLATYRQGEQTTGKYVYSVKLQEYNSLVFILLFSLLNSRHFHQEINMDALVKSVQPVASLQDRLMGDISKTSDVLLLANPYWRVRNGNMS